MSEPATTGAELTARTRRLVHVRIWLADRLKINELQATLL